jgi:hypothetical protein
MEAKELSNKIFEIKDELEKNDGVALFVNLRIKTDRKMGFEPWLKVELCGILCCYHGKVEPEKFHTINSNIKKIDIIFGVEPENEWAISLKDIITSVKKLEKELRRLKEEQYMEYNKTCLVFLTFWRTKNKDMNIMHFLENNHRIHYEIPIRFKNGIDGRMWFVLG